ncbi:hypothetical protein PIB30_097874, partial [Stylosanthes scabra]|nr:hypothetical protein [Stylosanthes scabra]
FPKPLNFPFFTKASASIPSPRPHHFQSIICSFFPLSSHCRRSSTFCHYRRPFCQSRAGGNADSLPSFPFLVTVIVHLLRVTFIGHLLSLAQAAVLIPLHFPAGLLLSPFVSRCCRAFRRPSLLPSPSPIVSHLLIAHHASCSFASQLVSFFASSLGRITVKKTRGPTQYLKIHAWQLEDREETTLDVEGEQLEQISEHHCR